MTIKVNHESWQPSCWVGGVGFTRPDGLWTVWMNKPAEALASKKKESLARDSADKANSAILLAMRN